MKNFTKILVGTFLAVALVSASSADAAMTWSRSLKLGSRGADVKSLQQFLNMCADTKVSMSGAGSPGMESTYFGPATKAAVMKWQMARGVNPASGLFGPLSRAKAAELQASSNVCGGGVVVTPPTGTGQTGPVMASLSATTPAAGYIIDNQATAGLLDVTFTGSGVVNSITLMRSGISDQNTLKNVYLYDGAVRLTDGYSFNNQSVLTMNNLNLMVNGSKTISVKADVASNASSNSTIAVALTGFTSGASVNNVNIVGNLMNLASGSSLATATLSANTVTGSPTINAGTTAYTFWSAPLQVNTRALWLKSAAFRMIGSAPSDALSNIKLFVDGVDTGKTAMITPIQGTNYAVFDFMASPMSLTTGSHTVDVRATVDKGSSRTVQLSLQQAADLMITDPQVGVNVAVGGTVPNSASSISINTGSLTANRDTAFNALTNVTGGASNVAIAKYTLRAYGEDVKINTLDILPVLSGTTPAQGGTCPATTSDCGLQNVALYFNGSQIGTQTAAWTGGNISLSLGSQLIVPAGTNSTLEVRADIRNKAGSNYTAGSVSANLVVGSSNAQGQNSFNTLGTPAVTGNVLTIQTGLLAVSKNTGYANQNATPNTQGVKIGSFSFQNQSSSESVRVTSLQVALGFTGSQSLTNLSALRTSESSGSGATPVQPQATNTFSVDFTLAPGATKTIDVLADTGSVTTGTVIATLSTTSLGVSSNVSQTVSGVTGQTITVTSGAVANPPTFVTASATQAQYIAAGNGGAADATKATYNFVSNGGTAVISELKFTVTGSNTVTSVKVGSVSAPVVGSVAYLTGLNLVVPNGGSGLTQDVYISYSEVGTNGIVPATTSATALTYLKYTSGGTTAVIDGSSTPALNLSAPTMTLVGSKPTVTVNSVQSSGLILGAENKIGEVTVSADAKGNIKLNDIQFSIGSSNISTFAITSPRLADGTTTISGTSCGANATATTIVFCEFGTSGNTFATGTTVTNTEVNTDFDGYTIAAGTSKTFSLYGVVGGTITTGGGNTTVSSSVSASGFNWDDASYATFVADGTAASPANGTALTGTLVYNFPTNSYSIKQ
jgi:hypothetical protein